MDPAIIILAISGIKSLIDLVRGLMETARQSGELTPEMEAEWLRLEQAYRASPAGTPTNKGKL